MAESSAETAARKPSRLLASLGSLVAVATMAGCATFRGPGDFEPAPSAPVLGEGAETPPAAGGKLSGAPGGASSGNVAFDWPVEEARVSRGFKAARKAHWGIDLANAKGTPILAAEKGQVIYVGREFKGYGRLIVIEHDAEWATLYAHIDKFLVKEGDYVRQGQPIATMGRTGRASGVHLHFEIRQNRIPVNPLGLLPQGF